MVVSQRVMLPLFSLVLAVSLALPPLSSVEAQADATADVCEQIAEDVITQIGVNCAKTQVGTVCYAAPNVEVELSSANTGAEFGEAGDTVDASLVSRLMVGPLDVEAESWGVNVLNLQANLPTGFGEGARVIAFGGVELESAYTNDSLFKFLERSVTTETSADTSLRPPVLGNPGELDILADIDAGTELQADAISEDGRWVRVSMDDIVGWVPAGAVDAVDRRELPVYGAESLTPFQAFHFRSSEASACSTLSSGLLIQGHEDYPIDIIVNDVPIRIESTIFLRTRTDSSTGQTIMDVFVLFGLARINAGTDDEIIVPPGFLLSIFYNYQPGDFDVDDLPNVTSAISFSSLLPLTREILDSLTYLLDIPSGLLFYPFDLSNVSQPSGVGGAITQVRFANPQAAAAANALCQSGELSDDICAILGF